MPTHDLKNSTVAVLATDGFEQSELFEPLKALKEAGATAHVIAPKAGRIKGWDHTDWGKEAPVDRTLDEVSADQYDALVLPGGVMNPDKLRMNEKAVRFTSYESIKTDLRNAGAEWVDEQVVVDNGLVTSRKPDDLPAFIDKMLEEIHEGKHAGQHA